ncbi:MAG: hypothetical protein EGR51_03560, partial [Oscillibacter sp.]|nr:hypothetical protein [Oscillibacter sp.]
MLKFDKMPESWNRKTLSQKEVREMAGRSERRLNQARSENDRYQAPSQPTSSFNKAPKKVATNKIQTDTLWDIMRKSITDPGHISEVVDSTTGQEPDSGETVTKIVVTAPFGSTVTLTN